MENLLKGVKELRKTLSDEADEVGEGAVKKRTVEDLSQAELVEICRKQAGKLRQLQTAYNQLSSKCAGMSKTHTYLQIQLITTSSQARSAENPILEMSSWTSSVHAW